MLGRFGIGVDWPQSGPVRNIAFFGDRRKEPDGTVQIIGTAVRSEKYGPVSSMKMETVKGTGLYGLAL